jgi:hypothetical protein
MPRNLMGSEYIAHIFLTSVLDGGEWSALCQVPELYPIGFLSPTAGLDAMEKRKMLVLPGNQIPGFEPVARRYAD